MHSVIVEFQYGDEFDRARIAGIAHEARGRFEGLPRLRQKAFTIDEQNRRATNVYLWESEDAARGFFNDELVDKVTRSRLMGTSVAMIDRTYGHLARDSEDMIRARLDARSARDGVEMASEPERD
jgi:hypothetical protein